MYFNSRLWAFTRGFRGWLALGVAFGLLTAAAGVARLALGGYVIVLLFQGATTMEVLWAILAVAGAIVLRAVFQYLKEMTGHRVALEIQVQMRRALYAKAQELGAGTLDRKRTGDVTVSLVEGVDRLETYFGQYLPQLFVAALTPVGVFVFMVFLDAQLALVYLLASLFTVVAPALFHGANVERSAVRRKAYGDLAADFLDSVQGLATLKAFGQSKARGDLLAQKAHHVYQSTMKVLAANMGTTGVTWFGVAGGAALALGWGAVRVSGGTLDLAVLVVFVMLGVEVFRPLRELTILYHNGMLGLASATAVFDLLDSEAAVREEAANAPASLEPSLEFDNVTFRYPTREHPALEGVSFRVAPGEAVAVVGPSGAGKSTLVWLALRLWDVASGSVRVGGHDVRSLPMRLLRSHIAVVTQDTYLFHGTVADNLRFGKPDATHEELERAARLANAHEFIAALPEGYDTVIGERGVRLSGGQRQRIAIARALLKDAPILILDEALSSVDAENEAIIQEALERLMQDRTTLVIAHRLSSVVRADRVVVLENGRLVEEGTPAALMAGDGVYRRLMAAQAGTVAGNGRQAPPAAPTDRAAVAPQPTSAPNGNAPAEAVSPVLGAGASPLSVGRVFLRLFDLVRPWRGQLAVTFTLGVLRVFVLLAIGVVSSLLVRQLDVGADVTVLLAILALLAVLTPLFHWGETWLAHDLAFRLLAEMRVDMYRKLDPLAPAYLVQRRSGDVVSVVTGDVETVELFFAHTIAPAFVAIAVPGVVLATLAVFQWQLALALLPFLLLVAWTPFSARRSLDRLGSQSRDLLGEVNAHMVDSVQGMREITAFCREDERLAEVVNNQRRLGAVRVRFFHALTMQRVVIESLIGLGGLAVLGLGTYFVLQGSLAANVLPLLTILALASFIPVSEVAQVGRQLADTVGSARRVFAIHDEPVPVTDGPGVATPVAETNGDVQYDRVTFRYRPSLPDVLRDVAFTMKPGSTVALVGRSGAGKTTAAHLLLRFWDPTDGRITLDKEVLRRFELDDLRRRIALVAQDTYLFNASVRENLRIARLEATDEEVEEAAKNAAAHEFIVALPDGYDTPVGERGFQLSGGQRQRIAIARAFLRDAPVLVLDEATSHLDTESEALVHQGLERLRRGRTTLLIAHRLSTVQRADLIVLLDDGRVVEQGTHDALLAQEGLYAELVSAQLQAGASR